MSSHQHEILREDALRNSIKVYAGPKGSVSSSFMFGSLRMIGVTGQSFNSYRILRYTNDLKEHAPYVYRVRDMRFDHMHLYIRSRKTEFEVQKLWEQRGMVLKVLTSRK